MYLFLFYKPTPFFSATSLFLFLMITSGQSAAANDENERDFLNIVIGERRLPEKEKGHVVPKPQAEIEKEIANELVKMNQNLQKRLLEQRQRDLEFPYQQGT